jgi:hypothetical protein
MKASRAGLREPRVRTSFRRRLAGEKVRCPTRDACAALTRASAKFTGEQARLNQQLLTAMTQKSVMLDQLRRDRRYRAILGIWLVAHVLLSFALLAALTRTWFRYSTTGSAGRTAQWKCWSLS